METMAEMTAETVINDALEQGGNSADILSRIRSEKYALEKSERAKIDRYINEMRPMYAKMIVDDFVFCDNILFAACLNDCNLCHKRSRHYT
jgi:hypothetical protein